MTSEPLSLLPFALMAIVLTTATLAFVLRPLFRRHVRVARWRPRGGAVGRAGACGILHAAEFEGFASSMPSNRGAPG